MSHFPVQESPTGPDFQPGEIDSALDQLGASPSPAPAETARTDAPSLARWSELLGVIPTDKRLKPITEFSRAIHEGVIQAATITEEFNLPYVDANGEEVEFKSKDELILDTPEMHDWFRQQATESTYTLVSLGVEVKITEEQIVKGELDFTRLAEIRRAAATTQQQTPSHTAAASARKPKPKPKLKSTPNTSSKTGQKSGSATPEKAPKDTPATNE
ncbi:hypothetical protein [Deinococcus knuensis]|uniref:Uncharacterized protein n=1 Tax=Deinococcus knuensis TaxID=1837380 RepID=A0ABQ2SEP8_9DEIO|nr:hypothetical protein [Deinococcus knuensis]GGS26208.1 hypothetical protein GCM10008961_17190 [Deinococcus knuensis]